MTEVHGQCDYAFDGLAGILSASCDAGADIGASIAVSISGEMVVDLWAGHLDAERTRPWQENTIVNVYSTTKTMTFLTALLLADRGQLDFDAPVSIYWPEFAQAGKGDVKVWHVMDHAAGLSGLDHAAAPEEIYDWGKITRLLASQASWWTPGTATGYHALTQGFLIGEIVKRITGQTIGTFFQKEIAKPLEADFFIGVPESEFSRIGDLIPPPGDGVAIEAQDDSVAARTFKSPVVSAQQSRETAWKIAEIPAANGHGNARSVVKVQSIVANLGSAFGVDLISETTARSVMQRRIEGMDLVLGAPLKFGLGYGIVSEAVPLSPNANSCFWGGWGGSVVIIDQDERLCMSYVMNNMHEGLMGDERSRALIAAMYRAL